MMPTGLARLEALEAIRELPLRYSVAIEHRDVDAMAALFSPNARFGRYGRGEAGLRALMGDSMSSSLFAVILVANHLIAFDDATTAHGQVWARCYAQNEGSDFTEQLLRYDDAYEAIDGRWSFVHRRHRMFFGTTVSPSPLLQEPASWPAAQHGVGDIPLADPLFAAWHANQTGD